MSTSRCHLLATSAAAAAVEAFGQSYLLRILQTQAPEPVFTPIRRNVGYFTMRGGTIGYLVNSGAVVVIDSQFPAEGKSVSRRLEHALWKPASLPSHQHAPSR
jgi:hypothetical protein